MRTKFFNPKLPDKSVVWAIGIPYKKDLFDLSFNRQDKSDFIESLEFTYGTNDPEILWREYQPIADNICKTIEFLKSKRVDVIELMYDNDISSLFEYDTIILTAHRHRYLNQLDLISKSIDITAFVNMIPYGYNGTIDISSCYSITFNSSCKLQAPYAKFIAAKAESSIDLRMFIYKHTIKHMANHQKQTYIDSIRVVLDKIFKNSEDCGGKRKDIFLGGDLIKKDHFNHSASVFAPREVSNGDMFLVQVYIYKEGAHLDIIKEATKTDEEATERSQTPLSFDLKENQKIKITLRINDFYKESKTLIWTGRSTRSCFIVTVPIDCDKKRIYSEVNILIDDIPIGELYFVSNIIGQSKQFLPAPITPRQFKKVFISYSHLDEDKVRYIAEAYKALKIDYFFDRHYLSTGDIYPLEIKQYIENADLFFLCWSKNAANSEYVAKEIDDALKRAYPQKSLDEERLFIYPISIEPKDNSLPQVVKDNYIFGEI